MTAVSRCAQARVTLLAVVAWVAGSGPDRDSATSGTVTNRNARTGRLTYRAPDVAGEGDGQQAEDPAVVELSGPGGRVARRHDVLGVGADHRIPEQVGPLSLRGGWWAARMRRD